MRVAELINYGEPLQTVERPGAEPGPGQVRIRVAAATVNPVDWLVANGVLATMTAHLPLPLVLGWDVVGQVDAAGPGSTFEPEQWVAGLIPWFDAGTGAFAETVVAESGWLALLPDGLDPVLAATVPLNGQTARQAVNLLGPIAGATVVITGAGGGVGGFAVQLAAADGAQVVAVASARDADRVRKLGATQIIGRDDDVVEAVRRLAPGGADAVLDAAPAGPGLIQAVRDNGTFVGVLDPALPSPERGISATKVSVEPDAGQLADLLAALATGRLTTRVAEVVPLAEAAKALEVAAAGGLPGKVVLVP